jgi:type II secretory pathway pseudopilin PulG
MLLSASIRKRLAQRPARGRGNRGFTYVGLMVMVAIIAIVAAASVQIGAIAQRRMAEEELLAVGLEFKSAVRGYFEATPVGTPSTAPRRLEDLLRDPRYPSVKRYLRKIYDDPLTGKPDWGIVRSTDGGILGVFSKAEGKPIRQDNFPDEFFHFRNKKNYRGWVFVYGVVCTDEGCELPNKLDDQAEEPKPEQQQTTPEQEAKPAQQEATPQQQQMPPTQ